MKPWKTGRMSLLLLVMAAFNVFAARSKISYRPARKVSSF